MVKRGPTRKISRGLCRFDSAHQHDPSPFKTTITTKLLFLSVCFRAGLLWALLAGVEDATHRQNQNKHSLLLEEKTDQLRGRFIYLVVSGQRRREGGDQSKVLRAQKGGTSTHPPRSGASVHPVVLLHVVSSTAQLDLVWIKCKPAVSRCVLWWCMKRRAGRRKENAVKAQGVTGGLLPALNAQIQPPVCSHHHNKSVLHITIFFYM